MPHALFRGRLGHSRRSGRFQFQARSLFLAVFTLVLLVCFGFNAGSAAAAAEISIVVNGEPVVSDEGPIIVDNRTLVPLRLVSEALGAQVDWDGTDRTITVHKGQRQIKLQIDNPTAYVGGEAKTLDVPPLLVARQTAGRTMVPFRFIGETLGAHVDWLEDSRTVTVNLGGTIKALQYRRVGAGAVPAIALEGHAHPDIFLLPEPHRLVLDFPDTTLDPALTASLAGAGPVIRGMRAGQGDDGTARVVVDLMRPVEYELLPDGNGMIYVLLDGLSPGQVTETDGNFFIPDGPPGPKGITLQGLSWEQRGASYFIHLDLEEEVAADLPVTFGDEATGFTAFFPGLHLPSSDKRAEVQSGPLQTIFLTQEEGGAAQSPGVLLTVNWQGPLEYHLLSTRDPRRLTIEVAERLPRPNVELVGNHPREPSPQPGQDGSIPSLPALRNRLIVVDAGHGGKDPGTTKGRKYEKELNLAVALQLEQILKHNGARVVMTRSGDWALDLDQRTRLANDMGAEVFVSIHFNSSERPETSGTETYYHPDKEWARPLAAAIHKNIVEQIGYTDNGLRTANFFVLRETYMPAALVEVLYLSNPVDEELARRPETHSKAALGIALGLNEYFRQTKP